MLQNRWASIAIVIKKILIPTRLSIPVPSILKAMLEK